MKDKTDEHHRRYQCFHNVLRDLLLDFAEETTISKKHFQGNSSFAIWGLARTDDDKIPVLIRADLDDPDNCFKVREVWFDEKLCEELYQWLKEWKESK
jgi:hypothetical protein